MNIEHLRIERLFRAEDAAFQGAACVAEVRRLRTSGDEDGAFKQLVANLSPDKRMLEEATFTLVTHVCGFSCVLRRAKEHSRFANPVR